MPELTENPEAKVEQEISVAMHKSRERLGVAYDNAISAGKSPLEMVLLSTNNLAETRKLHGDDMVEEMLAKLPTIREDDREIFLDGMMALAEPMIRQQITNPEIRQRVETITNSDMTIVPTGSESEPHLEMRIHAFDTTREKGKPLDIGNGETLQMGDTVMEISWPNTGTAPRGLKDVLRAMRAMAKELQRRTEVKAVTAVSWMVSREGVMDALGFHTVADIKIDDDQRKNVVDWATSGRADKPYQRGVAGDEVKFAFLSRDEFLAKYGDKSN